MSPLWETAKVAEPTGLDQLHNAGSIVFNINQPTIFSLNPAEDFEINTNVVQGWELVLMNDDAKLGNLEYFVALEKLKPYIIDQQSGSVLVGKITSEQATELIS